MAKQTRNSKSTALATHKGKGIQLEQTDHFDDTPLPDADELAKYKQIDPNIIEWLMRVTEKEQNHRHSFDNVRANEIKRINNRLFTVDIFRIACAFLIVMAGMAVSAYLITLKLTIIGSVFAGGTILTAVAMFLNIRKNPTEQKK